jgi:hypothetical protein
VKNKKMDFETVFNKSIDTIALLNNCKVNKFGLVAFQVPVHPQFENLQARLDSFAQVSDFSTVENYVTRLV